MSTLTIKKLLEQALTITTGNSYPVRTSSGKETQHAISFSAKNNHSYNICNDVCAFVFEHKMYVMPAWDGLETILKANGFSHICFYVPLSTFETPLWAEKQWKKLTKLAFAEKRKEFAAKCQNLAETLGLKDLPSEVMSKCLQVPPEGIQVSSTWYDKTAILPCVGGGTSMTPAIATGRLGHFGKSKIAIMFLDKNGQTWISPVLEEVETALEEAGYSFNPEWPVALDEGFGISDIELRIQWDQLTPLNLLKLSSWALELTPGKSYSVKTFSGVEEDVVLVPTLPEAETFSCSSGICMFTLGLKCYVMPYWENIINTLKHCEYRETAAMVPLANGETPMWAEERWEKLKTESAEARHEEFVQECLELAKNNYIAVFQADAIDNHCLMLPSTGAEFVKADGTHDRLNSWCGANFLDSFVQDNRFGQFCCGEHTIEFVHADGSTIIAPKTDELIDVLILGGYKETSNWPATADQVVSFVDPELDARWKALLDRASADEDTEETDSQE